ncbi:hypothetical protein ACFSTC_26640 [Nonomuraea ferruginea]
MTRIQISRRLLAFGRPLLVPLAVSVLFRVLQQCLGIALYGVGAWGVVRVVSGEPEVIGEIAVAMVVMAFAKGLFRYVEQYSGHFVAFKLLALLRDDFYERIEPQAPAGTEGGRSGDLLARVMKDIDRIEVFYAHTIAPAAGRRRRAGDLPDRAGDGLQSRGGARARAVPDRGGHRGPVAEPPRRRHRRHRAAPLARRGLPAPHRRRPGHQGGARLRVRAAPPGRAGRARRRRRVGRRPSSAA